MTPFLEFNPYRITLGRERRSLTKINLANRAGIGTRTLYDIESGKAKPNAATVHAIAQALRFPVEFFYKPTKDPITPDAASFRALRSISAKTRGAALAAGHVAFDLSRWLDQRFRLPEPNIPDLRDYEPEAAAQAARVHWGIGERPIGNMVHFLEAIGVRVFSLSEDRRVDAFSLWHDGIPFVFLNTIKTAEHGRMDAAHELGHLVLHRHGVPRGRNLEMDAQAFGAAFLMPRSSVLAYPRLLAPTLSHIVQMKKKWSVSAAALARRLHRLGRLSDHSYRSLCVELAKFGRTKEPEGIARETSQVLARVFGELGASKNDAARDMAVFPSDVEALVFGLRAEPQTKNARTLGVSKGDRNLRLV